MAACGHTVESQHRRFVTVSPGRPHGASEGFVALLEPLIDTIIICTMTALTIVITGAWDDPTRPNSGGSG